MKLWVQSLVVLLHWGDRVRNARSDHRRLLWTSISEKVVGEDDDYACLTKTQRSSLHMKIVVVVEGAGGQVNLMSYRSIVAVGGDVAAVS